MGNIAQDILLQYIHLSSSSSTSYALAQLSQLYAGARDTQQTFYLSLRSSTR